MRCNFGLTTFSAAFSALLGDTLRPPENNGFIERWLDDILIHTETLEKHFKVLEEVLDILEKAGCSVHFHKSMFRKPEVESLGVMVDRWAVRPRPSKIKPHTEMERPTTVGELPSFVGMANFLMDFVKDFSALIAPITDILRNKDFNTKRARHKLIPQHLSSTMYRYALRMMEFTMTLQWRKGAELSVPDALSRLPQKVPAGQPIDTSFPDDNSSPSDHMQEQLGPFLDGVALQRGALLALGDALLVDTAIGPHWAALECAGANAWSHGVTLVRTPLASPRFREVIAEAKPEVSIGNACRRGVFIVACTRQSENTNAGLATKLIEWEQRLQQPASVTPTGGSFLERGGHYSLQRQPGEKSAFDEDAPSMTLTHSHIMGRRPPLDKCKAHQEDAGPLNTAEDFRWGDFVKLTTAQSDFNIPPTVRRTAAAWALEMDDGSGSPAPPPPSNQPGQMEEPPEALDSHGDDDDERLDTAGTTSGTCREPRADGERPAGPRTARRAQRGDPALGPVRAALEKDQGDGIDYVLADNHLLWHAPLRGSENVARVMQHPCTWLKVSLDYDPFSHRRAQGAVERMGGWLQETLSVLYRAWTRRWNDYVPVATWIHRVTPDPSLPGGASPYQILFGRAPRSHIDLLAQPLDSASFGHGLDRSVEEQHHMTQDILAKQQEVLNRRRERHIARITRESPEAKAQMGDLGLVQESPVSFYRDSLHPKLAHEHFTGQTKVINVLPDRLCFTVQMKGRRIRHCCVVAADVKPFHQRPDCLQLDFEDAFNHLVWSADLGLADTSFVAVPLYTLIGRRVGTGTGGSVTWAWEYRGRYQDGAKSGWITEGEARDNFSPLQLDVFHAFCKAVEFITRVWFNAGGLFESNGASASGDGRLGGAIYNVNGGVVTLTGSTTFKENRACGCSYLQQRAR
eukprot:g8890.t1